MIRLKNVIFESNGKLILNNISYTFFPNHIYVIFGKSGIGKSTLLKAIVNLINYKGDIFFDDVNSLSIPPQILRTNIIYIHQEPLLFGERVIDDINLVYNLKVNRNKKFDKDAYISFLKQFGYDESFLNKKINELSGGQKQIAAILKAMTLKPRFLMLDEPTSALDVESEQVLLRILQNLKTNMGLILISHSLNVIKDCDKQILFSKEGTLKVFEKMDENEIKKVLNE
ncbi:ATP-binding cassette domain-containing protein [Deferribacter thermophilus]|uniref:ABC transporter ATP-binding protein n=1 Tax=Deferribacter thermophilus TaxID=53573 RepID=UPI003C14BE45